MIVIASVSTRQSFWRRRGLLFACALALVIITCVATIVVSALMLLGPYEVDKRLVSAVRERWFAARSGVEDGSDSSSSELGTTLFGMDPAVAETLAANMKTFSSAEDQLAIVSKASGTARSRVLLSVAPDSERLSGRREPVFHKRPTTDGDTCTTECKCTRGGLTGYGRYCGYDYTGCIGYGPCDGIDECCRVHDNCVVERRYTDCNCTTQLAECVTCEYYKESIGARDDAMWKCSFSRQVASTILADMMYLLPACFDDAEKNSLAAAVNFDCPARDPRLAIRGHVGNFPGP